MTDPDALLDGLTKEVEVTKEDGTKVRREEGGGEEGDGKGRDGRGLRGNGRNGCELSA